MAMGGMVRRVVLVLGVVLAVTLAPAVEAGADLTLTASSARLGPGRTSVVLRGSYTCGPFASGLPDRGVIDLSVQQVRGGTTVTAFGYLEPSVCDGSAQPYRITLTGTSAQRFRVGSASWSASGYVEGDTGLQHVQVDPTPITLRP
jgi:hypothetical protein